MAPSIKSVVSATLISLLALPAAAERELVSTSLATCMKDSMFSATLFDVALTPANDTLSFNINGVSSITGHVLIDVSVYAYGFSVYSDTIDPCSDPDLKGMCPMNEGQIPLNSNLPISAEALSQVPGEHISRTLAKRLC